MGKDISQQYGSTDLGPSAPPAYGSNSGKLDQSFFDSIPQELRQDVLGLQNELKNVGINQGLEAKVCLVLDISHSMENPNKFFSTGKVQALINKVLALAKLFDDDGKLEVFTFGATCSAKPFVVSFDNFTSIINDRENGLLKNGTQDSTNYAAAVRAVREFYFKKTDKILTKTQDSTPVFTLFVTDGEPNTEKNETIAQFRASSYQPIFWKILALQGFGQPDFDLLQNKIDDAPTQDEPGTSAPGQRFCIDCSDFKCVKSPEDLTYKALLEEFPQWLQDAHKVGLLTEPPNIDAKIVNQQRAEADRRDAAHNKSGCCLII